jgi:hypothetical protein
MCLSVSRLFWVSSLAYPNLLGTKGYVVVVYLILYVPHASCFKKYSKHCDMLNSLAGTRLHGTLGWNPLSYKKPQKIIIDALSLGECRNHGYWILIVLLIKQLLLEGTTQFDVSQSKRTNFFG